MRLDLGWDLLGIFKAGSLTVFSILLITIMGGAFVPFAGDFLMDMLLWFALSAFLAAAYVWAAYRSLRRKALQTGAIIGKLTTLSEVAYEVLGLLGGGFFGMLAAALAWDGYRKAGGFEGYTLLMSLAAIIGLSAFTASLVKLGRYLRFDI